MTKQFQRYGSWSRLPVALPVHALKARDWRPTAGPDLPGSLLAFGAGRTYGDSAVAAHGTALDTAGMDRVLGFDSERGQLWVEAGASLAQVLEVCVPRGWFPPVCPGTRAVTVGGAIAHDVHGKNQPTTGTFGLHVAELELLRSDGSRRWLSLDNEPELFRATLGGLGLTGLILSARLRLRRIQSAAMVAGQTRLGDLGALLADPCPKDAPEYRLVWIDSLRAGPPGSRAVEWSAGHATDAGSAERAPRLRPRLPVRTPALCFNRTTLAVFNRLFFARAPKRAHPRRAHYSGVLFPQDRSHPSNHLYGRRGVYAYHALIPREQAPQTIPELLERVQRPDARSMVTVLKPFGELPPAGLLSFSGPGISFVAGFPNEGQRTLDLLADLDQRVRSAGGKLYPAKDARMPLEMFRHSFPEWERFHALVDPAFGSSFWQRVCGGGAK